MCKDERSMSNQQELTIIIQSTPYCHNFPTAPLPGFATASISPVTTLNVSARHVHYIRLYK